MLSPVGNLNCSSGKHGNHAAYSTIFIKKSICRECSKKGRQLFYILSSLIYIEQHHYSWGSDTYHCVQFVCSPKRDMCAWIMGTKGTHKQSKYIWQCTRRSQLKRVHIILACPYTLGQSIHPGSVHTPWVSSYTLGQSIHPGSVRTPWFSPYTLSRFIHLGSVYTPWR